MKYTDYSNVKINNGFWKKKLDVIKNVTVWAVYDQFKKTHRFDALSCSWRKGDENMPHIFWDSDVAKWMEGASYLIKLERNEKLESIIDDCVDKIVKNSDENGYFNSHFLVTRQDERFKHRSQHELYCAGHLMEAACAYFEATGKDKFLKTMCKYADYIEKVFMRENSADFVTPGHPELELALMRLYAVTKEKRYAELAKFFIDMHGNNDKDQNLFNPYNKHYVMDALPLREVSEPKGHAVRAMYLLAGMADVACEYDDTALKDACKRCYESTVNKRMYITGGIGSAALGEAFTVDYHLPNRTAYTETCAAIALAMFSRRMQKTETDSCFADTVEKVIFNGALSGMSEDGKSFFYENPLEIDLAFNKTSTSVDSDEHYPATRRAEVFSCSCCPPNILRFFASIGGYAYSFDENTVYIDQFIDSEMNNGEISLTVSTDYPNNGKVKILDVSGRKRVAVRIPEWCESFSASKDYVKKNGYAVFDFDGNEITVDFDMPAVIMEACGNVHENVGRIAVMRGPVVYCAEGADNISDIKQLCLDINSAFTVSPSQFSLPAIKSTAYIKKSNVLYKKVTAEYESVPLTLIPYYAFANRDECNMAVWLAKK